MSYRSLKRVLGETSLERKCRFLFGGCLLVLITGSFWWYGRSTEELVYEAEPRKRPRAGRNDHRDAALEVLAERRGPQERRKVRRPGRGPAHRAWPAASITGSSSGRQTVRTRRRTNSRTRSSREFPLRRPLSAEDVAGTAPSEFADRRVVVDGKPEYQYYTPIRITNTQCALCHASLNLGFAPAGTRHGNRRPGVDRQGGPARRQDAATPLSGNNAVLLATAIITVFLAMLASLRDRALRDRQAAGKHLRDVSDADQPRRHRRCGPTFTPATSSRSWPPRSTACCGNLATNQDELQRRQRRPERQGRRAGPGQHAAVRDEPAEERLSGHDEPRAAHAAQPHHRLQRRARDRSPRSTTSRSATCGTSRRRARCCWR